MARELDAKCKLCRRSGEKLFLKGERCFTPKCAMVRRPYAPGAHGKEGSRNQSEFGRQLAMKQKIKRIYGVLEKQFRKHFEDVQRLKGVTGDLLLQRLESRLDNVVYRMAFAPSRTAARQLISHGALLVNGKKVDIPSFSVKVGDVVSVKTGKLENAYFRNLKETIKDKKSFPGWINVDISKFEGKVLAKPTRSDIDANVDAQVVVEFYSK